MREHDHVRIRRYTLAFMERHHGDYPQVRQAARALRWTQQRVLDAAECAKDEGGFDLLVGFGIPGIGTAEFETIGEYELEAWHENARELPTYDERRADPQPCACGRLVTRPDLCAREGCCLLARHPATGDPK